VRRCAAWFGMVGGAVLAGCAGTDFAPFRPDWEEAKARANEASPYDEERTPEVVEGDAGFGGLPDFTVDGPIELSVEQAAVLALRQNRDLDVAQLTPAVVGAFETIARGEFEREIFADAEFGRERVVETARATQDQFSVEGDSGLVGVGVRQRLSTGTDIELGVTETRSISNRSPEQQTARVGLTVTQSLLRGFGPAVNLVDVRLAELDTRASLYELRGFTEALVADAEVAYWEQLLAERTIEIFERSLAVARQQFEQVRQRIELGDLPRTEAAAAGSEVALREAALIDARAALAAARLRLFRLMNAPLGAADRAVRSVSEPVAEVEETLDDIPERVELALRARPDLGEARLRVEQGRLEVVRTRNGLLPRLDLFIALGKTGFADTFPDAFEDLDSSTYDFTAGLSLTQTLGESEAVGRQLQAVASREQARASLRNLEQVVELDVRLAVNDARRAREQIAASATARRLATETAEAEQQRFEVGASTALLVSQAQRDQLAAEIAEVEAITQYRIALVRLYLAEGSLLERRGVRVAGGR
jgi:outer membrane protein